jgi:hemoglobin
MRSRRVQPSLVNATAGKPGQQIGLSVSKMTTGKGKLAEQAHRRAALLVVGNLEPVRSRKCCPFMNDSAWSIATVVDDFIDRIMDDPRLNANPKVNEAHHRVSRAGFKYLVTEQVCQATGGPQRYTGRSMYDSHARLDITEQEWQAFLDDFRQTLAKFGVPEVERTELFSIVDSTKQNIVLLKKQGGM